MLMQSLADLLWKGGIASRLVRYFWLCRLGQGHAYGPLAWPRRSQSGHSESSGGSLLGNQVSFLLSLMAQDLTVKI